MLRASRVGLLAFAVLLLAAGVAYAQSQATTGVIQGTVKNESGAPMAGANVTLTNTGTNFEKTIATDSAGRFRAVLLPLGRYKVSAAANEYATIVQEGVDLAVGQTLELDLVVKPASVSEAITVTA